MDTATQVCKKCGYEKSIDDFYEYFTGIQRRHSKCKTCTGAYHIMRKFGITPEEYNFIFTNQGGRCAICYIHQSKLKRAMDVDHDHETGKVRGLLCAKCNVAIGLLQDSPVVVSSACDYLKLHKSDSSVDVGEIKSEVIVR